MQQFKTLLLREWMQHRKSWLLLGLWSPVIVWALVYLVLLSQGIPQLSSNSSTDTTKLASIIVSAHASFVLYFSVIGVLITVPGLPYRDKDDKSLAFWRSLPIDERSAVGVPVLMHGILLPLLAISAAIALNLLLSAPLWITQLPIAQIAQLPVALLVGSLQSLVSLLWLLPLVLMLALGNSLIRRWGMVLICIGALAAQSVLSKLLHHLPAVRFVEIYFSGLFGITSHIDFLSSIAKVGSPVDQFDFVGTYVINAPFVISLLVSVLCVMALIWRRQTGQTA